MVKKGLKAGHLDPEPCYAQILVVTKGSLLFLWRGSVRKFGFGQCIRWFWYLCSLPPCWGEEVTSEHSVSQDPLHNRTSATGRCCSCRRALAWAALHSAGERMD